jgi:ABC-type multidrug transport system ATPase subunit
MQVHPDETQRMESGQDLPSHQTLGGGASLPGNVRRTSTFAQFNAVFRKTARLQSRSKAQNCCQCVLPLVVMVLLMLIQTLVDTVVEDLSEFGSVRPAMPNPEIEPASLYTTNYTYETSGCYRDSDGNAIPLRTRFGETEMYLVEPPAGPAATEGWKRAFAQLVDSREKQFVTPFGNLSFVGVPQIGGVVWPDRGMTRNYCENDITLLRNITFDNSSTEASLETRIFDKWGRETSPGGYMFRNLTLSSMDVAVVYNYTLTAGVDLAALSSLVFDSFLLWSTGGAQAPPVVYAGTADFPARERPVSFDLVSLIGPGLFHLLLHMIMPVIITSVVYEKEHKLLEITKMMGMRTPVYWAVTYIFSYLLYFVTAVFMLVLGNAFGFRFFTDNNGFAMFMLFFLWGHTLVAWSFFLSLFFNKSRVATSVGYLYVIVASILVQLLLTDYFRNKNTNEFVLFVMTLLPTAALWRAMQAFSLAVIFDGPGTSSLSDLSIPELRIDEVYAYLFFQWLVLIILFFYLDQVYTGEYGVARSKLFFLEKSFWTGGKSTRYGEPTMGPAQSNDPPDVAKERADVAANPNLALRTFDLRKVFEPRGGNPEKVAVRGLSLGMHAGEVLGYIGSNGAGKSTTINMISGLLRPTSGTATIFGLDIRSDMEKIHSMMGVCPQDNLIWERLTADETTRFYGRLKGLSGKALDEAVKQTLTAVSLQNEGSKLAGEFSGGMKRRLCVACAVIGDPKVIILDEPSTGLDPRSRRELHKCILRFKRNAAIFLVTHSHAEATLLCDRVAIFMGGELRTVGTVAEVKARHGKGYRVSISADTPYEEIATFMERNFDGVERCVDFCCFVLFVCLFVCLFFLLQQPSQTHSPSYFPFVLFYFISQSPAVKPSEMCTSLASPKMPAHCRAFLRSWKMAKNSSASRTGAAKTATSSRRSSRSTKSLKRPGRMLRTQSQSTGERTRRVTPRPFVCPFFLSLLRPKNACQKKKKKKKE